MFTRNPNSKANRKRAARVHSERYARYLERDPGMAAIVRAGVQRDHRVVDSRRQAGAWSCWTVTWGDGTGRMTLAKTRAEARRIAAARNL